MGIFCLKFGGLQWKFGKSSWEMWGWKAGLDRAGRCGQSVAMMTGVIGCGKMGRALLLGAIRNGAVKAEAVMVCDPVEMAVEEVKKEEPVAVAESLEELFAACDCFLICTKPAEATMVTAQLGRAKGEESSLVISIAAGVTVEALERAGGAFVRVIRAMPNTPALIGKGAAAFCRGEDATDDDADLAKRILGSVGTVCETRESLMDAVTGLSGSGPAYVYTVIESLADGGVKNGLPRDQALTLAAQTVLGAAAMVQETGLHPAVLRDMVTSPGGTTIAGLAALEEGGIRASMMDAVTRATKRSRQLGRPRGARGPGGRRGPRP